MKEDEVGDVIEARPFKDRRDAGRRLARQLKAYAGDADVVVLGLARGGVPVAYEVAASLGAPLDVFVVRKLGYPAHEELAIGAIASGGTVVFDPELIVGLSKDVIDRIVRRALAELNARETAYHSSKPALDLSGKTAILIDDGLATGSTMHAAVRGVRSLGAKRVVVAVPVSSRQAVDSLRPQADDVVAALVPELFYAVGQFYEDFAQTSDDEVRSLLAGSKTAETRG